MFTATDVASQLPTPTMIKQVSKLQHMNMNRTCYFYSCRSHLFTAVCAQQLTSLTKNAFSPVIPVTWRHCYCRSRSQVLFKVACLSQHRISTLMEIHHRCWARIPNGCPSPPVSLWDSLVAPSNGQRLCSSSNHNPLRRCRTCHRLNRDINFPPCGAPLCWPCNAISFEGILSGWALHKSAVWHQFSLA